VRVTVMALCVVTALLNGPVAAQLSLLVSPDGTQLAYAVPDIGDDRRDVTRIMVCGPDGSEAREVAGLPDRPDPMGYVHEIGAGTCWADEVYWLGEDRLLCPDRSESRWAVVTTHGERLADLTLPEGCDVLYTSLSPDGARAAFVGSYRPPEGEERHGVYVVDLETGEVRLLLEGAQRTAPTWSPDGTTLAIANSMGYGMRYPLVFVEVESGRVIEQQVDGAGVAWAPHGRTVAFAGDSAGRGAWVCGIPADGRIGILTVEMGDVTYATPEGLAVPDPAPGELLCRGALGPVWSRDGTMIAYRQRLEYAPAAEGEEGRILDEVWGVRRDGTEAHKVLDGEAEVAWAADGTALYALRPRERELLRIDLEPLEVRTIAAWRD